jgi:hypothetical protein
MKAFGAEVVLTDPLRAVKASMERVEELKKVIPNAYVLDQVSKEWSPHWNIPPLVYVYLTGTSGNIPFGLSMFIITIYSLILVFKPSQHKSPLRNHWCRNLGTNSRKSWSFCLRCWLRRYSNRSRKISQRKESQCWNLCC